MGWSPGNPCQRSVAGCPATSMWIQTPFVSLMHGPGQSIMPVPLHVGHLTFPFPWQLKQGLVFSALGEAVAPFVDGPVADSAAPTAGGTTPNAAQITKTLKQPMKLGFMRGQ